MLWTFLDLASWRNIFLNSSRNVLNPENKDMHIPGQDQLWKTIPLYFNHRQTTLRMWERVTSVLFWDSCNGRFNWSRKMFHKNSKSWCFFSKIHFMDSQINKVHSPTIFCLVLSDLMGFWDALISSSDPTRCHVHYKYSRRATSKTAHGRVPPEFSWISPTSKGRLPPSFGHVEGL